jgi:hypothetical protein
MARQLIVVSREDVGLYHALCADWAGDPDVAVVLDRRRGQRRHDTAAVPVERRRQERRQHPPLEAHLAWRGGGATARKSDVLSVLSRGSSSIVVRQRPVAKSERRAALRPSSSGEVREESFDVSMLSAPANTVVALVILVGTLSGGIVGGLALWLFLAYEFASRRDTRGSVTSSRPDVLTWWQRPLHKLRRSYRPWAPAEKSSKA